MHSILSRFLAQFPKHRPLSLSSLNSLGEFQPALLSDFLTEVGFGSFALGLVRFVNPARMEALSSWERVAGLKEVASLYSRLIPFASSWRGNLFCFDRSKVRGEPRVTMLELGTGELLEVAGSFPEFIEIVVVHRNTLFSPHLYEEWCARTKVIPDISQCIGYRQPLFLNGSESIDNLEISDHELYVDICGQLFSQASTLPPGTSISEFLVKKGSK